MKKNTPNRSSDKKTENKRPARGEAPRRSAPKRTDKPSPEGEPQSRYVFSEKVSDKKSDKKSEFKPKKVFKSESLAFKKEKPVYKPVIQRETPDDDTEMRLNKFVALCGIASRRAAADLIKDGLVQVNDAVVTEIGYHVKPRDKVFYRGKRIEPVVKKVYILMNKPKDVITTVSDERGRKTVMDLISRTIKERVYPVGRLDRLTTGLLLLTNDGDLAQKLSHPSFKVKKLYHVGLDKALSKSDLKQIQEGITLDDGPVEVDSIMQVEGRAKDEWMIEIHIGKNRIVRRIFEHLGYNVVKLDRVYYGGLTKKDLPRGGYRSLTEREIIMLKHFQG